MQDVETLERPRKHSKPQQKYKVAGKAKDGTRILKPVLQPVNFTLQEIKVAVAFLKRGGLDRVVYPVKGKVYETATKRKPSKVKVKLISKIKREKLGSVKPKKNKKLKEAA